MSKTFCEDRVFKSKGGFEGGDGEDQGVLRASVGEIGVINARDVSQIE